MKRTVVLLHLVTKLLSGLPLCRFQHTCKNEFGRRVERGGLDVWCDGGQENWIFNSTIWWWGSNEVKRAGDWGKRSKWWQQRLPSRDAPSRCPWAQRHHNVSLESHSSFALLNFVLASSVRILLSANVCCVGRWHCALLISLIET